MDVTFFTAASNVLLEVEVAPAGRAAFEARYQAASGTPPADRYMTIANKWGVECRIYFDAPSSVLDDLAELNLNVNAPPAGRYAQEFRVNSGEFFWALIDAGYRLGTN